MVCAIHTHSQVQVVTQEKKRAEANQTHISPRSEGETECGGCFSEKHEYTRQKSNNLER